MRIVFCGVGALGSSAAMLCRGLGAELSFVDFDRVESKNLFAQAFVKASLGKNKAEALKLQLATFYGIRSEAYPVRLVESNVEALCGAADLVVDSFDNAAGRRVLQSWARSRSRPLVHAALSADGSFGLVRWTERFVPDPEDEAGQATCEAGEHLPMVGVMAGTLARIIQDFARAGQRRDAMVGLLAVTPTG
jgi:hypothetical protein